MTDPRPLKLLIVEDAPFVRAVLTRLLAAAGHDARAAEDGRAGLVACASERFDAVLADIHLPDLDGPDLIGLLRTGRGPNRTTPVVLVSGDAPDPAELVGADGFVAKPVEPAALLATLARAVSAAAAPSA